MNNRGFTLVEVLIALAVFIIALGVSVYLFRSTLAGIKKSYKLTEISFTIQAKMEELRSMHFEDLSSLSGAEFADGKGKITVIPMQADLLTIAIELPPIELHTMRSKY